MPVAAFDLRFKIAGDEAVSDAICDNSLLKTAEAEKVRNGQDIIAAARTDYQQILGTLYKNGYYSGTVSILLDGQEAADLPPFFTTKTISNVQVRVNTGEPFKFGRTRIVPLAPGSELPAEFMRGEPAKSPVVGAAVDSAILSWRQIGYAKAEPRSQSITADHRRNRLDVSVELAPGPIVRFGSLDIRGAKTVREKRIRQIAGLEKGEVYSPKALDEVARRLRDTGTFRSVALSEGEVVAPDGTMDITARLVEEKPRRFGFGAELLSTEGLSLSSYWMHRNILGGAENLRFDASVGGLGGSNSGLDYRLAVAFSRPGTFAPANTLIAGAELAQEDEPEFKSSSATASVGVRRRLSDRIEYTVRLRYRYSKVEDDLGERTFSHLSLPVEGIFDARDELLDPRTGNYFRAEVSPYLGLSGSASGARFFSDNRGYYTFGESRPVTLAGRLQFGSVIGSGLRDTPPDLLFYSGGGGTVRGHPYQSLSVDLGNNNSVGADQFPGAVGRGADSSVREDQHRPFC